MKRFNTNDESSTPTKRLKSTSLSALQHNVTSKKQLTLQQSQQQPKNNSQSIGWDHVKGEDSFSMYMHHKNRKLRSQFEKQQTDHSSDLFKNVVVWVNGWTDPSRLEIRNIMLNHQGSFETYLTSRVTHIIATQLSTATRLTFQKQFKKSQKHIVTPKWITESLKLKVRQSEAKFSVPGMRDPFQKSVTSMFKNTKKSKK